MYRLATKRAEKTNWQTLSNYLQA